MNAKAAEVAGVPKFYPREHQLIEAILIGKKFGHNHVFCSVEECELCDSIYRLHWSISPIRRRLISTEIANRLGLGHD